MSRGVSKATLETSGNHFVIKQLSNYGFEETQFAELKVRRVQPQCDPEHVQIEISCGKRTKKRTMQQSFSMHLLPEHIEPLIAALQKLHPPYDKANPYVHDFVADRAKWREFYGLPPYVSPFDRKEGEG